MKNIITFVLIVVALGSLSYGKARTTSGAAEQDKVYPLGLQGYDPITYFTEKKALKGNEQFKLNYDKHTFYFTSEETKMKFKTQPQNYLPQFDGKCGFAVSIGKDAEGKANLWTIKENKLYLNNNRFARFLFRTFNREKAAQGKWAASS